ncbi:translesion DNA synthesis-associated protein ImuA [Gynuella sp.]|uniref:translesion DNA synthesis-associated protein ImuA n=1 Tax=Gynuella sp. TaxID=2969146 RepID=UPI003D0AED8A
MDLLQTLTDSGQIWSGNNWLRHSTRACSTGYSALDAELPGGGWPLGAVTEILCSHPGQGELRLILPCLAKLGQQDDRWQFWLNPPYQPHGLGLLHWGLQPERQLIVRCERSDDLLWSIEQALLSGGSNAVIAWADALNKAQLRRIQLAAEKNLLPVFLLRPLRYQDAPSTAALRLSLYNQGRNQLCLHILKSRGAWAREQQILPVPLFHDAEC